jgi:putative nucleotidyltransferase with HDIG domain
MSLPSRQEAWELLKQHTQGDGLLKHAQAVELAMRAYALKLGEDPELWGLAGLLHDFDYEAHPSEQEHPYFGANVLRATGYPEALIRAILSHAPYTGVERITPMEKALFAVDELCGFLVACALVQPGRSLSEVKVASVLKKLKDEGKLEEAQDQLQKALEGKPADSTLAEALNAMQFPPQPKVPPQPGSYLFHLDRVREAENAYFIARGRVFDNLVDQLKREILVGRGVPYENNKPHGDWEIIKSAYWTALTFDPSDSSCETVSGGGHTYKGLQIGKHEG